MSYAIATRALCHAYPRGGPSLRNLDLRVPEGSIYGFLGANGAGKTTTMRLLLGLLRPSSGEVVILGHPLPRARREILEMTGSMIESPGLYGHLSARENLALPGLVRRVAKDRIDAVLETVGLATIDDRPAAKYSLGMRQRLGIAAALLHAPRLLILDEPTNGLDPGGIVEMRTLLQRLNADGITVFLSSHLLAEIEKVADHVGVIHAGRLVFQGTLGELRQTCSRRLSVTLGTNDPVAALALIIEHVPLARRVDDAICLPPLDDEMLETINRYLVQKGIGVHEISTRRGDLETLYLATVEAAAA